MESLLGLLVGDWGAELQIRGGGGGGGHPDPETRGGGLGPQFGLKIKGGGPLRIRHWVGWKFFHGCSRHLGFFPKGLA